MNEQEAMDETTVCTLDEARLEVAKHGFDVCNTANTLMAFGQGIIIPEIVAVVDDEGNVSTKAVLEWLGY